MIDPLNPKWTALKAVTALSEPQRIDAGWRFTTDQGALTLLAYAEGIFRLRLGDEDLSDYGFLVAAAEAAEVDLSDAGGVWTVAHGGASLGITADPVRITLKRGDETVLRTITDRHFVRPQRLPALARSDDGWFAALALNSGEPVYGLGEKWGPLNHRGQIIVSKVEDALGVNAERSYKNCPFAWSPEGWGIFAHTPAVVTHGVGHGPWSQRSYALAVADEVLDLFLIAADNPAALLERYTHLTGRMPMPPLWSLGTWLSKAYYKDGDELLEAARSLRERKIPCDVITLDGRAWQDTDTRFAFEWDPKRYTDPKALCDQVHGLDLRLCCWEYPLISVRNPLFQELADKGWLVRDAASGEPYRYQWDPEPFGKVLTPLPESGLLDFTHPEAFAFWRDKHKALFDAGVDVIKPDFGEQIPDDGVLAHNGDGGRRLHNAYPLLYNRCVFEAREKFLGEGLVFGRSGYIGSQRYPLQWGGDPQTDWEGLAGSLRGGLSWGLSGVPCYATDIGGFYGPQPDAELFVRWTQAAVFCSHLRFHGIGPREPWAFGEEAETLVRRFLELRYRLIPYIQGTLEEAAATGLPAMRAMVLACPDDPAAWAFDTQYLFGPDLLVAPVLRPGGQVQYYLPAGDWYDLWTGEVTPGGKVFSDTVTIDRIPVFVRANTALALGPVVQSTQALAGREPVDGLRIYGVPDRTPCVGGSPIEYAESAGAALLRGVPKSVGIQAHRAHCRWREAELEITPAQP